MSDDREIWLSVPGYDGRYDVSDQGRIRSWIGALPSIPKVLAPYTNDRGYRVVDLSDSKGKRRQRRLHCLILETFVGPRPAGFQGAHEDDDKDDNSLENLSWKSRPDNIRDRSRNGRTARGEKHGAYKHGKYVGRPRKDGPKHLTEGASAIR